MSENQPQDGYALKETYPYYLANKPVYANQDLVVTNKYTDEPATTVALADAAVIDKAIAAAEASEEAEDSSSEAQPFDDPFLQDFFSRPD